MLGKNKLHLEAKYSVEKKGNNFKAHSNVRVLLDDTVAFDEKL